jgi:hypothetical protein
MRISSPRCSLNRLLRFFKQHSQQQKKWHGPLQPVFKPKAASKPLPPRASCDVVIRIRAEAGGTRLDIRSASRVGRTDLGVNAKRIRAFLLELNNLLKSNT